MTIKKQPCKIPNKPGVYFFKNKSGRIIYIGKAQNLAMRLKSYFAPQSEIRLAKQNMLEEAASISWQETASDIEALILESSLIKKFKPAYNVVLKDDKNYFFVGFTKEEFPKIFITHQPFQIKNLKLKIKNCAYVGPFTEGAALKTALKKLRKILPYCTCKELHKRPCLRAEINKCLGICCLVPKEHSSFFPDFKERKVKYRKNILALKAILEGRKQSLLKNIKKEMRKLSEKKEFEKAEELHNELAALEKIFKHRNFIRREEENYFAKAVYYLKKILKIPEIKKIEAYDISNIQGKDAVGAMVNFEDGKLNKNKYRRFLIRGKKTPDDIAMLKEILGRRLKHQELPLPQLFLIDGGKAQFNATKKVVKGFKIFEAPKIASLAKKEEKLYTQEGIFHLKKMPPPLLHFLQYIRNEAHRFAIQYHKLRRKKSLLQNIL